MTGMRKPTKLTVDPIHARVIRSRDKAPRHYWRAEVYRDGSSRTVWSGWTTRDELRQRLARMVQDGTWREKRPTLRAVVEITVLYDLLDYYAGWLDEMDESPAPPLRPRSRAAYRSGVTRASGVGGDIAVSRLADPGVVDSLFTALKRAGFSDRSSGQSVACVGRAVKWGHQRGLVSLASIAVLRRKLEPCREAHIPTHAEVGAVLATLDPNDWRRCGLELIWLTGLRIHELARLRPHDIGQDVIHVPRETKTGARKVPLVPAARLVLARLADRPPHSSGTLLGVSERTADTSIGNWVRRERTKLKQRRWTPHSLRHAFAQRAADTGRIKDAAAILGHSEATMLKIYNRSSEDGRAAVTGAMGLRGFGGGEVIDLDERRRAK